jgi:hypothetical protein
MRTSAVFSPCRRWRYQLVRTWADTSPLVVIGLNPSTADETTDDATIRRCVGFAKAWGHGGLIMLNLFALRATDPRALLDVSLRDAIGPENGDHLLQATAHADRVLCAWGAHGRLHGRGGHVASALVGRPLVHFGLTKGGQPKHPLYLRADMQPEPWAGALERRAVPCS